MARAIYFNQGRMEKVEALTAASLVIDADGDITLSGGGEIKGLPTVPTGNDSAASKSYVDSVASGLDVKGSVRLATADVLDTNTYDNGTSGVGATITCDSNGALSVDGVTPSEGDRILVKDEVDEEKNGIYIVTDVGDVGTPFVLTRATDADSDAKVTAGMFTFITEGDTNADTGWVLTSDDAISIGTTGLLFTQFSNAQITYTGGLGITVSGTSIAFAPSELTTTDIASSGSNDYILFTDGSDSDSPKRGLVQNFLTTIAGDAVNTGLIHNSGVLQIQLASSPGLIIADRYADGLALDIASLADGTSGFGNGDLMSGYFSYHDNGAGYTKKVSIATFADKLVQSGTAGLNANMGKLSVKTDSTTINIDGSGNLYVPNSGIGAAKLASAAIQADSNDTTHLSFLMTSGEDNSDALYVGYYLDADDGKMYQVGDLTAAVADAFMGLSASSSVNVDNGMMILALSGIKITPPTTAIADDGGTSFSFTGYPVFLTSAGKLTTTDDDISSGEYYVKVGKSISSTAMITDFSSYPVQKP